MQHRQSLPSTGTKPERIIFAVLKARKIYFAPHVKTRPGKPDIVFRRKKVAVFIDSDFWHGHPERFRAPASNVDYWQAKIARNRARDLAVTAELTQKGWTVLRLWEWDIRHDLDSQLARLLSAIGRGEAAPSSVGVVLRWGILKASMSRNPKSYEPQP